MAASRLRALLAEPQAFWLLNAGGASVDVVDMLARAGVRCLFIDCERTAVGIESVAPLTRCAHSHGMAVTLRSESAAPEALVRYLDRGIDGIVVPHTETVQALQQIGEVVHYVTKGRREQVVAIAQVESHPAVENVEALAQSDAVDAFLVGPNDLSHSMGFLGDTTRAELVAAVDHAAACLQAAGRAWGLPATEASAPRWTRRGAKFLYGTLDQIVKAGFGPMSAALAADPTTRRT